MHSNTSASDIVIRNKSVLILFWTENQSDTDKKRKRYIDGSDDDGGEVLKRSRQSTCKDTEHTRQTKYILPITSKSRDSLNVLQENCGSKEYENQILSLDDKRKGFVYYVIIKRSHFLV